MKYILFSGDGMGDYPIDSLKGKTPIQVAKTPNMDKLAKHGKLGMLSTIPDGLPAGSEVAILSLFGYDPMEVFPGTGRGALEAPGLGVELDEQQIALRCNLITEEKGKIKDYSAGHISSGEARELIKAVDERLGNNNIKFYPGVSYRHILVIDGKKYSADVITQPPHDNIGKEITAVLPGAETGVAPLTSQMLSGMIINSKLILENHEVNRERVVEGKNPANLIWPWSPGRRPKIKTFQELFGIKGAVISAVDIVFGIGHYAGMDMIRVEGATGMPDTNYEGKADATLKALQDHDFVFVHAEGIDESSHSGDVDMKIKAIEDFDKRLIGRVLEGIEGKDAAVAVMPDHLTPISTKVHARDPVPFLILRPGEEPDNVTEYSEISAKEGSIGLIKPKQFIRMFLGL